MGRQLWVARRENDKQLNDGRRAPKCGASLPEKFGSTALLEKQKKESYTLGFILHVGEARKSKYEFVTRTTQDAPFDAGSIRLVLCGG